jgi:hypothetical protein
MKGFVLDVLDRDNNIIYSEKFSQHGKNLQQQLNERGRHLLQTPNSVSSSRLKPASFRVRKVK